MTEGGASALDRFQRDAGFEAALRASYAEAPSIEDALVWLEDPQALGATGRRSPWAGLGAARRSLYRPDSGEQALTRYRELERSYAAFVAGVRKAIARAEAEPDPDPTPPAVPPPAVTATPEPARPRVRRRAVLLIGAVVAVVLAFAAGIVLAQGGATGAAGARPPGSGGASPTPSATGAGVVLELLDRPPTSSDRVRFPIGGSLVRSSFRLLQTSTEANTYIARSEDGQICLVAAAADRLVAATCSTPPDLARAPLQLDLTLPTGPAPSDGGQRTGEQGHVEIVAYLDPDGSNGYTYPER